MATSRDLRADLQGLRTYMPRSEAREFAKMASENERSVSAELRLAARDRMRARKRVSI